jgi:NADH:ubiquinone oxidoreductase subunit F (NADH-binding)
MNAAASIAFRARAARAANDSFYHLRDCDVREAPCRGMACFVARDGKDEDRKAAQPLNSRIYCLGKCYAAPASGACNERPHIECPAPEPIVLSRILKGGARTLESYRRLGGFQALAVALSRPPREIISAVESSQLRGRGGAAFPTGQKWRTAAEQKSDERFVIANGDEGDAGAYVDRILMEDDPFAVIEGLTLAAHAIGAKRGWIYVRAEYPNCVMTLDKAIEEAIQSRFLGPNILGTQFSFNVEVVCGKGSYFCGEETALIRSIEELRPEAQVRPPYSAQRGLFGKPTVMNNIETLVNIPWITLHTGDAYASFGFGKSRGTKVVSLNSLFRRPGMFEVEFGITVRDIVEELGGGLRNGKIKGLIIGGPLAGIIPPELFDTTFEFEALRAIGASVGHGGLVAFDERTSIAELIHHVFEFGSFESCGKCAPCRLGSRRVEEIFRTIVDSGCADSSAADDWRDCVSVMKNASLCAHGTGLAEFAESALRYYRKELKACFA